MTIQRLVLNENLEIIEDNAFYRCIILEEVIIPSSIKSIGYSAFYKHNLSYPTTTKILLGCFSNSRGLKNVTLGKVCINTYDYDPETYIFNYKFINIPTDLEIVEDYAFMNCWDLEYVELPSTIKYIGVSAFNGCFYLRQIIIHSNNVLIRSVPTFVTPDETIEELTDIEIYRSIDFGVNENIVPPFGYMNQGGDDLILNDRFTELSSLSFYQSSYKKFVLREKITTIPTSCFFNSFVEEIDLSHVTKIEDDAFAYCINLKKIIFGKDLILIGENAFLHCISLEEIKLPEKLTEIGNAAFWKCEKLKTVQLPSQLLKIPKYLFLHCYELSTIDLPQNLQIIEEASFGQTCLGYISIPDSVTEIGNYAFWNTQLTSVDLPANLQKMNFEIFAGTQITSISIHSNIKEFRISSVADTPIEHIVIPRTCTCIIDYWHHEYLKTLIMDEKVKFNFVGEMLDNHRR